MQLARYMTLLLSPWVESARSPSPSRSDAELPPAPSRPRRESSLRQVLLPLLLPAWLKLVKPPGAESHAKSSVTRLSPGKFLYSAFSVPFFFVTDVFLYMSRCFQRCIFVGKPGCV